MQKETCQNLSLEKLNVLAKLVNMWIDSNEILLSMILIFSMGECQHPTIVQLSVNYSLETFRPNSKVHLIRLVYAYLNVLYIGDYPSILLPCCIQKIL